ncbi:MAG: hypothetical protein IKO35_01395, partial [Elusimicrobiaceae bacterium]|nr:hypothetical protein [Elusimicrobiaceae bacterium]
MFVASTIPPAAYTSINKSEENNRKFKNIAPTNVAFPAKILLTLIVVPANFKTRAVNTARTASIKAPNVT